MSARLSLAGLQAHPDTGGLRRIAGPASAAWDDVVVESSESDLLPRTVATLAVLMSAAPTTPWQQDALLRRIHERGYRGVAMPGAAGFDPGAQRLAERLGICVLDVKKPIPLARACWMLLQAQDALTLAHVRKVAQSFEYTARDLPDLLRQVSANLGYALALVDETEILHQAGGELDPGLLPAIDFRPWVDFARTDGQAAASVRVDSPSRPGLRLVVFGEGLGESQLASLSVAAEVAMPAIAARILIDEVAEVNDVSASSALLRDFVDARGLADDDVERRMAERGWRTAGHHLGFRMIGRGRLDPLRLLRAVRAGLAGIGAEAHVTTAGRGVSGWLAFSATPAPAAIEGHVQGLRALHGEVARSFAVATGVGSLQRGPQGLATTLDEAADAARIAASRSATGWFVRVDSLGLEQLLLAWTGNDTFVPAAASLLAPLDDAGPDLRPTLSAYLDHESSLVATAQALNLHRNTVALRIRRVQELLGLDLSDPETRLAVHLACRAVRDR
ncbi:PucR family transcriptional regulator [Microbacterium azadirachtae]|uniref:PucR family transcriptional regulator n=1 Tax=Microbacterium azadirachtae TaxID=582680 RepID=UPI00088028B0|nr:helix-turn-helix domain-containing protein [Microbacterium azadirachtae]SDM04358.1 PucR C-terminal helix-turn-helix domain-containing protein [Microbacterium azadirachtae]SEG29915.1 PucR C-terminal helix-turn-helix domain-containing protein [Microbacterium azadirachtae]SEG32844.1 PucR C-terminal helix-turn-helix domain-containing protein [Microbacterium azadirachtae]